VDTTASEENAAAFIFRVDPYEGDSMFSEMLVSTFEITVSQSEESSLKNNWYEITKLLCHMFWNVRLCGLNISDDHAA
jgi:hypothetical protein